MTATANRRSFAVRSVMRMACGLVLAGMLALFAPLAAAGAPSGPWIAGQSYHLVSPPQPVSAGDKIEVLEVFSYACPHCARFQPYADRLRASLPADARFALMPADFEQGWDLFSRAFYTAKALGVLDKTHQALFDALHRDHKPLLTLDALAGFYAGFGVDRGTFLSTAQSFIIDGDLQHAHDMEVAYGIDSTPTLIVDGKFRVTVNPGQDIGFDQMVDIALYLVHQEEQARHH